MYVCSHAFWSLFVRFSWPYSQTSSSRIDDHNDNENKKKKNDNDDVMLKIRIKIIMIMMMTLIRRVIIEIMIICF